MLDEKINDDEYKIPRIDRPKVFSELFNDIVRNIEMFDYSDEERIRLIEENTI